jgi:hypothetical protein
VKASTKTATKRALAASAAVAGIGGSVVAFPEPASAHVYILEHADANAKLQSSHLSIYACHLGTTSRNASVDWFETGSTVRRTAVWSVGCFNIRADNTVRQFRLCVDTTNCSAWKREPEI